MGKEDNSQLELFSQLSSSGGAKNDRFGSLPLGWIRNYEKTILIVIAMIVTGVISFSLGVEKGKVAPKEKQVTVRKEVVPQEPQVIQKEQKKQEKQKEQIEAYTIQLASYKTKKYAEKEAKTIEQKGLTPLILSKGRYVILCVGNFSDRKTAKIMLSQFNKRYKGCYVRRL